VSYSILRIIFQFSVLCPLFFNISADASEPQTHLPGSLNEMHYGMLKTEGRRVVMEWIWITQSKNRQANQEGRIGERQKDLISSRPPWALTLLKEDAAIAHVCLPCFQQAAPDVHSFTKGHGNTSSPHNLFLGSSFNSQIEQDLTSCGPIKLHSHRLLCVCHYLYLDVMLYCTVMNA